MREHPLAHGLNMMDLHAVSPLRAHVAPEVQAEPNQYFAQLCFFPMTHKSVIHAPQIRLHSTTVFSANDVHKSAMYVPVTKSKEDYPLIY